MKSLTQHQAIIINIMISSIWLFFDFANVSLKNLLKTRHHAALNENIRSIYIDVEREERQRTLLQSRMKVVEYELSFITLDEIQSIIDDVKILQRQQNYLKMCAWCKTLFIENIRRSESSVLHVELWLLFNMTKSCIWSSWIEVSQKNHR